LLSSTHSAFSHRPHEEPYPPLPALTLGTLVLLHPTTNSPGFRQICTLKRPNCAGFQHFCVETAGSVALGGEGGGQEAAFILYEGSDANANAQWSTVKPE
jgi:hypothetical protein